MLQPHHPTIADYTEAEFGEYQRLIAVLLSGAKRVVDEHGPHGAWIPVSSERPDQVAEARGLIADLSRILNTSRNGLRRLDNRVRMRLDTDHGRNSGAAWFGVAAQVIAEGSRPARTDTCRHAKDRRQGG
ncbi:hypothetical protein Shyhy02_73720 [Streptomyces hygroscopicus subsp. hygroscopicus]|nr:hypothetical protein Shyhy02_73720 [Streptomyces hygroscopicus subsp. hygroscopicus]